MVTDSIVMATDGLLRTLGLSHLTSCRVQEETDLWGGGGAGEEEVRRR